MKNLFFAAAMAVALFASCSSERENPSPQPAADGSEVVITFDKAGGQFDTRAFFDDTMEAEPWEKEIKSANVYVYDPQGNIIMHKAFSAADLTGLTTTLILPKSAAGTECTFYAVANTSSSSMFFTENELINYYPQNLSNYNSGYFTGVSESTATTAGLPMSGSKKAVVQPQGTPTEVSFVLRRALAKVALKVNVDEKTFAEKYHGGNIRVNYVEVINAASRIAIVANPQVPVMPMEYCLNQSSQAYTGGEYCNLFYLGENPPLDDDAKVVLRIKATFDQDGNFFTTSNDQIPFQWDLKIEGSGSGEIKRNGYYRISAQIIGIDALDNIKAFITAGEWETPVTPDTELLH